VTSAFSDDPFASQRVTVTVVQRTVAGRNDYGNATYTESRTDVPGCLVAWSGSTEDQDNADRLTDSATVYDMGHQWPVGAVDRVEIAGQSWEVDGEPARWQGQIGGIVVQLRRVRG
jgi:hypothetical protein